MKNKSLVRIVLTALICIAVLLGIFYGSTIKEVKINKLPEKKAVKMKEPETKRESPASGEDADGFKDGIYEGIGKGYKGEIKVSVSVEKGKISKIDILSNVDDAMYFESAKAIIPTVIEKQSPNVDTVSGATFSSAGILEAVYNALNEGGN